ncbi:GAF domain-containing protein [uncultured Faecalibaculum sp.]|uniref:GAF domain-containing protein n=2 Tax=uncultured Faecalibaculum sp. TaxID=1729681 RepID=UPI00272C3A0E|nr:GAF domain-containing protein [uncultured Faecalibaculum sp.]
MWYNTVMNHNTILTEQARALSQGCHPLSAICNILSLVYWSDETINWSGLYLRDGDQLYLGPFMGKPACTSIPLGTGVVGTCAAKQEALLVPDVHAFTGHIACDSDSRSEAVFPLMEDGTCIAVLDIDCLETDGISRGEFESFRDIAGMLEPLLRQLRQQTLPFSA